MSTKIHWYMLWLLNVMLTTFNCAEDNHSPTNYMPTTGDIIKETENALMDKKVSMSTMQQQLGAHLPRGKTDELPSSLQNAIRTCSCFRHIILKLWRYIMVG